MSKSAEIIGRFKTLGIADLLEDAAALHQVTPKDVVAPARTVNEFSIRGRTARAKLFMALRLRGWSYPAIGELFGMNHTSVIYAVSKERT